MITHSGSFPHLDGSKHGIFPAVARCYQQLHLLRLLYLVWQDCFTVEGEDLKHDFERLQLAMEMVGFLPTTRKQ